ncbi:MAG: hypothetical protein AAF335_03250 [Bacteroidota bacterium]
MKRKEKRLCSVFLFFSSHLHATENACRLRLSVSETNINFDFCRLDDTTTETELCTEDALGCEDNGGQTTNLMTWDIEGSEDTLYSGNFLGQTKKGMVQALPCKKGNGKEDNCLGKKPIVLDDMMAAMYKKTQQKMTLDKKRRKSVPILLHFLPKIDPKIIAMVEERKAMQTTQKKRMNSLAYSPTKVYHENRLKVLNFVVPYVVPSVVALTFPSECMKTEKEEFLLAANFSQRSPFMTIISGPIGLGLAEFGIRSTVLYYSETAKKYKHEFTGLFKTFFYSIYIYHNEHANNHKYDSKLDNQKLLSLIKKKVIGSVGLFWAEYIAIKIKPLKKVVDYPMWSIVVTPIAVLSGMDNLFQRPRSEADDMFF